MMNAILKRKLVTAVLVTASVAAFATLGDGGKKNAHNNLLSYNTDQLTYKPFSLKSGYNFRGNNLFSNNKEEKSLMLNTVITYQKGNATYILPLKKKLLLDKISFAPTATAR